MINQPKHIKTSASCLPFGHVVQGIGHSFAKAVIRVRVPARPPFINYIFCSDESPTT